MNENKVPCGGFRIGDGLAMDGNTLKSLGGAYVKVKANINDDDGTETLEFMDDSPLKTFEEIMQKAKTSPVTLLMFPPDSVSGGVGSCFFNNYTPDEINSINFCGLSVIPGNRLMIAEISINSDNKITRSISVYTLTPAT